MQQKVTKVSASVVDLDPAGSGSFCRIRIGIGIQGLLIQIQSQISVHFNQIIRKVNPVPVFQKFKYTVQKTEIN
jgi:hypothetical protein